MEPGSLQGRVHLPYIYYIRLIIIFGIFLRLYHYLLNRSLFGDEAYVAVNFFDRGFRELMLPLDYGQRAPIGYLWGVKLISLFAGNSELSLRLLSLLAGIASLFLFFYWLKDNFSRGVTIAGLLLLAIAEPLIYFSSEVKQYMLEMTVTLIALTCCVPGEKDTMVRLLFKAVLGATLIWFSFPIVFILAGIGLTHLAYYRKTGLIPKILLVFSLWAISFLAHYALFIRSGTKDEFLQNFWQPHFLPLSTGIFRWGARLIYQTLNIPLGLNYSVLAVIALFAGVFYLWKENKKISLLLLFPVLLSLAASALQKFPFHGRFLVFIVPALITWIAAGIIFFYKSIDRNRTYSFLKYVIVIALFAPPFLKALYQVIFPSTFYSITRQEIRPVIEEVIKKRKPGEVLFVHQLAGAQFKYYDKLLGVSQLFRQTDMRLPVSASHAGTASSDPVQIFNSQNVDQVSEFYMDKRGWFLFCRDKNNEEKNSLLFLNKSFNLQHSSKNIRASIYLFERQ